MKVTHHHKKSFVDDKQYSAYFNISTAVGRRDNNVNKIVFSTQESISSLFKGTLQLVKVALNEGRSLKFVRIPTHLLDTLDNK